MPSRSKKQQRLFGMIHALQKGELDPDSVSEEVRELAKKIDPESVRHFAVTKHKGLLEKKAEYRKEIIKQSILSIVLSQR